MKTQLAVSAVALIVGLSSISPVVAGPSSNGSHYSSHQGSTSIRSYGSEGEFTRAWNEGRTLNEVSTSSRSDRSLSSSARSVSDTRCPLAPRSGFNDSTHFPIC